MTGPGGAIISCTISFPFGDTTVNITPHTPLADSTTYTITVDGVRDLGDNPVPTSATTFTTGVGP